MTGSKTLICIWNVVWTAQGGIINTCLLENYAPMRKYITASPIEDPEKPGFYPLQATVSWLWAIDISSLCSNYRCSSQWWHLPLKAGAVGCQSLTPKVDLQIKKRALAPDLIFIRTYSRTLYKELFKIPNLLLSCSKCPALAQISPCFLKYDSDSKAPLPMSSGCIQPLAVAMHWGSVCLHSHADQLVMAQFTARKEEGSTA